MAVLLATALAPALHAGNGNTTRPDAAGTDTARVIDLEEAVVVASPKETVKLRWQPTAVSMLGSEELGRLNLRTVKDLTAQVPNYYMPQYGSRLTSAAYIRGIGSRINTPAVGLYIDNVPVPNMSGYDVSFLDVERIDVLRGPQGTLYGRNTMGGLMRIFTSDPLQKQGTRISLGGTLRNSGRRASFTTAQRLTDRLAISAGAFYEGENGFFRNDSTHRKTDGSNAAGGKLRLVYNSAGRFRADWHLRYEYSDQGGYAYKYTGPSAQGADDAYPTLRNRITAGHESGYRRNLLGTGLNLTLKGENTVLSSVTAYQHLSDRMFLDQDFMAPDIYTLMQKQQENTWTEEITLRNRKNGKWARTTGLFAMLRRLNTQAPVEFGTDGMAMLNSTFAGYLPSITATNPMSGRPMTMSMSLRLTDPSLRIDGHFRTPMQNYALFHQSVLKNLLPRLDLTLGLRLDYEHQSISYLSGGSEVAASYSMSMIPEYQFAVAPQLKGRMRHDYWQLLPKAGLTYRLKNGKGNVYAVFSKGFRSGGYNIQMCSDLYQQALQKDLIDGVRTHVDQVLQEQIDNARNDMLKQMFTAIKKTADESMPTVSEPAATAVRYKPEHNWNYEVGAHLTPFSWLQADAALFFIDTHNQQIARSAPSGLGRQMVNAGRSQSYGAELSLRTALLDGHLSLTAGYGYTHAEFLRYNDGKNSYKGNRVPFVPEHNLSAAAACTINTGRTLRSLTLGVNTTALGRIYWTESNSRYQNLYALLGAHVSADFGPVRVKLWGKNLTGTSYRTFYFESMSRGYAQEGVPAHAGIDVDFTF